MKMHINTNIKLSSFIFIAILSSCALHGQEDSFWSKVRIGGNIGIDFSNNSFSASIAPTAVYDINPWISTGAGLSFGYTNGDNYNAINYGGSIITLFTPIQGMQLSAEFEETSVHRSFRSGNIKIKQQYWYPALFLGAGYAIQNVSIGLRYDVLYDEDKSIYASPYTPFVRVFF